MDRAKGISKNNEMLSSLGYSMECLGEGGITVILTAIHSTTKRIS